jgi:hypothetical protein
MNKFIVSALAAVVGALSLASAASADSRNRSDDWRQSQHHDRGSDDRRHDDRRDHAERGNDRWRHNDRHNEGWRHDRWRHDGWRGGYRGAPRVVIAPRYADYCFIKKVRHYDYHGNVYVKKIRVCR